MTTVACAGTNASVLLGVTLQGKLLGFILAPEVNPVLQERKRERLKEEKEWEAEIKYIRARELFDPVRRASSVCCGVACCRPRTFSLRSPGSIYYKPPLRMSVKGSLAVRL